MNTRCTWIKHAAAAAVLCALTGSVAGAQRGVAVYPRYFGGGYGVTDPTFTVTPFGIQPLGYGYNGFAGSGTPSPFDWDMLRAQYEQGYQDALNSRAQDVDPGEVSYPEGMTATPRGAVGRVPHGSDGVKMWRVRPGQIALRWQGDPRIASAVTFALLDKSGRTLRRSTVTQLPVEIRFTPPANAVYYQAVVHYVDGATNTIMSKLRK